MQLAARGCFENRQSEQVQDRVRRSPGQQVVVAQTMVYRFSRNSTFCCPAGDAFWTRGAVGLTQLGTLYTGLYSSVVSFCHSLKIIFSFVAGLGGDMKAPLYFFHIQ